MSAVKSIVVCALCGIALLFLATPVMWFLIGRQQLPGILKREAASISYLVEAIHDYREDNGSWPGELADLIPRYVDEVKAAGWQYHAVKEDDAAMLSWQGTMHSRLVYVFASDDDPDAGWHASEEGSRIRIDF